MKNRIVYLDVLRVMACSLVFLMHTPHADAGTPGIVLVPIYFLTAAGLVMFFMVSGALLLQTNLSVGQFLKRRIGKIAGPWIFWTIFYMTVAIPDSGLTWSEIDRLFVYVSTPGRHIMWFMFALLGLYLITPILSKFVQHSSKKEVRFYLLLWCATLAIPWFSPYTSLDLDITNPLYYLQGYVGYFLLGYYLHTYKPNIAKYAFFIIALTFGARLAYSLMNGERVYDLFWYLSVPVMLESVAIFAYVQKRIENLHLGNCRLLSLLSDCSFGMYLVHIFIMHKFLWKSETILYGFGWGGQILITWLLTLLLSFAVTYAISYLPYSEYIVGFNNRKKK